MLFQLTIAMFAEMREHHEEEGGGRREESNVRIKDTHRCKARTETMS